MTPRALTLRAGPDALRQIRRDGFDPASIRCLAGASGGPKWLALYGLDLALLDTVVPALTGPVDLIGSSIGTWRYACYALDDPRAAFDRFRQAYIEQRYSDKPDRAEITAVSERLLEHVLGAGGPKQILTHPTFRTHVMAVRSRGPAASDRKMPLATTLLAAAAANVVARSSLGAFFERALFHDSRSESALLSADGFSLSRIELSARNLAAAILASSSIPLVLNAVCNIDGAPPGAYRDGGIIDYHLDLPLSAHDGITLYPHFLDRLVPGWFDKRLGWRKPRREHVARVLLAAPSARFVASLPGGKIPDRRDFTAMPPPERRVIWRQVTAESERLGDEWRELVHGGAMAAAVTPL